MERTLDEWCRWYEKFYVHGIGNGLSGILADIDVMRYLKSKEERIEQFKRACDIYNEIEEIYEEIGLLDFKDYSKKEKELLSCLQRCAFHIQKIKEVMGILEKEIKKVVDIKLVKSICWHAMLGVAYGRIFNYNLCGLMAVANKAAGYKKYEYVYTNTWHIKRVKRRTEVRDVSTIKSSKENAIEELRKIKKIKRGTIADKEKVLRSEQEIPLKNFWEWKITKPYL